MLIALGILFPQIFHLIPNGGTLFSPMHLPVLLCGLICGSLMGAVAGVLTPVLSALIFAMPPFPMPLIPMTAELAAYGALAGVFMRLFSKGKIEKFAYLPALICAMVGGRLVFVAARVLTLAVIVPQMNFFLVLGESFVSAFASTWAGIILQAAFIPLCMLALQKGHILEKYPYSERFAVSDKR